MNILIEGWRGINHSFSLVNQWQILELLKLSNLYFKDVPFSSEKWNISDNESGLEKDKKTIINNIPFQNNEKSLDVTYRISYPFNFDADFNSKILFVFGNCEFKTLNKKKYKNNVPERLADNKNFFIHTPSNWSKEGFLNAGFQNEQIIVIPHGIDKNIFNKDLKEDKINLKKKFNLNDSDFVLSNIGAMTQNKGIELLIAAYGILKKKFKNLKLILKDQSNLYNLKPNEIIDRVAKSEINSKYKIINEESVSDINIISENLNFSEIKDIYQVTDCYVSPYLAEGFNLTPLEAAACGTQIVVTKGGSTDDYFHNFLGHQIESSEKKVNEAYLLEPKLSNLVQILEEKIINKKDHFRTERSNYVIQNFSWEIVVQKLFKKFEEKLKK